MKEENKKDLFKLMMSDFHKMIFIQKVKRNWLIHIFSETHNFHNFHKKLYNILLNHV